MAIDRPWSLETGVGIPNYGSQMIASNSMPIHDYAIQGQSVHFKMRVDKSLFEDKIVDADGIKKQLVAGLVEELYKSKLIEFTWQDDEAFHTRNFHARIYAVPDTQVKILRSLKVI
jgi:hypothetical protein